ncbi:MAG: uracil-DNA glycosylase, partial [Pseudomonadales bacterium]|nr:uracil-DNA glycosylase [Pseudomonadales bacterium]
QDPYHGPGQAQGLCFSVAPGVTPPPSLKNIFKELANDLADGQQGVEPVFTPEQCSLVPWAEQGVLLLNAVLTVERSKAGSHQGKGWELFTDKVVQILNEHCEGLVFILWGSYAQKKGEIIDRNRHLVLTSVHPSPLSAHRGYFGGKHFSKANAYLKKRGQTEIDWLNVD